MPSSYTDTGLRYNDFRTLAESATRRVLMCFSTLPTTRVDSYNFSIAQEFLRVVERFLLPISIFCCVEKPSSNRPPFLSHMVVNSPETETRLSFSFNNLYSAQLIGCSVETMRGEFHVATSCSNALAGRILMFSSIHKNQFLSALIHNYNTSSLSSSS